MAHHEQLPAATGINHRPPELSYLRQLALLEEAVRVLTAAANQTRTIGAGTENDTEPADTPGAVDAAVTSANLRATLCRRGGYNASVRPPEAVTEAAKKQIMAAYGVAWSQARHYELDHLIELSAGGASDTRNLWPEKDTLTMYRASPFVHNDKDQVEAVTRDAICDGKASLHAVQTAVAANWTTAIAQLHLPAIDVVVNVDAQSHPRPGHGVSGHGRRPGCGRRYGRPPHRRPCARSVGTAVARGR